MILHLIGFFGTKKPINCKINDSKFFIVDIISFRHRYYSKYTEAYGLPVVSSASVSDNALKRACYTVRFLFADRKDVRYAMYKNYGRFGVIGINEGNIRIFETISKMKLFETWTRSIKRFVE